VAVQSLLGFPNPAAAEGGQGICWDPSVGMYRANIASVGGSGMFEPNEGVANVA